MNTFKTGLLLAAMTAIFMAVGSAIGGHSGMVLALMIAIGMNAFSYWFSDSMVLKMHGAQPVDAASEPRLYRMVERLAARGQLPMPRVYVMHTKQPNAFATGRSPHHAAVAATTGLLHMLNDHEIEAVMAHELAHIAHRDTLTMTITATIAGAIGMLANMAMWFGASHRSNEEEASHASNPIAAMAMMILAPLAAMLVQAAISRSREYEADRLGAQLCENPQALASALLKIQRGAEHYANPAAEANPATAHLFISNPLSARSVMQLFSTHPATEDRVAALAAMHAPSDTIATPKYRVKGTSSLPSRKRRSPWG